MASDTTGDQSYDFLVIGSGIAGLTFALQTAKVGRTLILTKKDRAESNSNYAQGGIAGVMSEKDNVELHKQDTLTAGAGLCHDAAVDILVNEGPDRIKDLISLGAQFNMEVDESGRQTLSLGREGGHSRNRIVHAVDRTGWECEKTLLSAAKELSNLTVLEHYFVLDLAIIAENPSPCCGVYALNAATREVELFRAGCVLLASGGCGQVYLHTTNPAIATGDGVAMAWRAGAKIANMEFIQFHPTALYHQQGQSFLISEAVRGEGGILRTRDGSTFMENYHPLGALAPRDIVARAIHAERMKRLEPCVYLDITHLNADFIRHRFPTIYDRCLTLGLDITREPIPVVPAAHYACGGVQTDLNGKTSIPGLYACGEVACTGVHGANRLASNSLLEAMVFGYRAAQDAVTSMAPQNHQVPVHPVQPTGSANVNQQAVISGKHEIKSTMNDLVGIVRNDRDLYQAQRRMASLSREAGDLAKAHAPDEDLWELRNKATVAEIIIHSAISRKESRGLHYNTDYPDTDDVHWKQDSVLRREA